MLGFGTRIGTDQLQDQAVTAAKLLPGAAPRYAPRPILSQDILCVETFSSETDIAFLGSAAHSIVTSHYTSGTGALSLAKGANGVGGARHVNAWGADGAGKDVRKCTLRVRFWSDVEVAATTPATHFFTLYLISDATFNEEADITHALRYISYGTIYQGWNEVILTGLGNLGGQIGWTKGAAFDATDVTGWCVLFWRETAAITILMDTISLSKNAGTPKVALTADDAYDSQMLMAALCEERGFRLTIGVVNTSLGAANRLTEGNVIELAGRGHKIVSHGWAHAYWNTLTLAQIETDLQRVQAWLYERGLRGDEYIWPGAAYPATDATWGATLGLGLRYMNRFYNTGNVGPLAGLYTTLACPNWSPGNWTLPMPLNDPRLVVRYPDEATILAESGDLAGWIASDLVAPGAAWCAGGFHGIPGALTVNQFIAFLDALKTAEDAGTIQVVTTDEL